MSIPGIEIMSGIIWCEKSMPEMTIREQKKNI